MVCVNLIPISVPSGPAFSRILIRIVSMQSLKGVIRTGQNGVDKDMIKVSQTAFAWIPTVLSINFLSP